jgi:hypothetical protein
MTRIAVIDEREITITPVFKWIEIENIPKSETAGHAVMETMEVVEVRFAGSKNYAPVFPAHEMSSREGNNVISYAERWADQYRAFKEGNPQEANGTPLEMLRAFGVSPEQLSLCRALRIYSIEALHHLEGDRLKTLGMNGNKLKQAAREFMAERASKTNNFDEVEALKARIAELEGKSTIVPEKVLTEPEIDAVIAEADAAYAAMSDEQVADKIFELVGERPDEGVGRPELVSMLSGLEAA